jgi:hypothetical protein
MAGFLDSLRTMVGFLDSLRTMAGFLDTLATRSRKGRLVFFDFFDFLNDLKMRT